MEIRDINFWKFRNTSLDCPLFQEFWKMLHLSKCPERQTKIFGRIECAQECPNASVNLKAIQGRQTLKLKYITIQIQVSDYLGIHSVLLVRRSTLSHGLH